MANEFAERQRKIVAFLNGLTQREKLLVLAWPCNDAAIIVVGFLIWPRFVLDVRRAHYRAELRAFAETERSNADLGLLAWRKGCRLEPAKGSVDLWHIVYAGDLQARVQSNSGGPTQHPLTQRQALAILRCLPDQRSNA